MYTLILLYTMPRQKSNPFVEVNNKSVHFFLSKMVKNARFCVEIRCPKDDTNLLHLIKLKGNERIQGL